jgi:hypothetical protein
VRIAALEADREGKGGLMPYALCLMPFDLCLMPQVQIAALEAQRERAKADERARAIDMQVQERAVNPGYTLNRALIAP